jgi:hypothetical protein
VDNFVEKFSERPAKPRGLAFQLDCPQSRQPIKLNKINGMQNSLHVMDAESPGVHGCVELCISQVLTRGLCVRSGASARG